jgi:hypothetical protein
MSDTNIPDEENMSLLSNLKNTVTYKVHKAVYNPDANKFAKEQQQINSKKQSEQQIQKQEQQEKTTELDAAKDAKSKQLNVKNVATNVTKQVFAILALIAIPTMSVLSAMLIANEMIVLPVIMRIVIFVIVVILFTVNPFYSGITLLIYLAKELHDRFTTGTKRYSPRIFALLPITTTPATTSLGTFFKWPFFYPKSDESVYKLEEIKKSYLVELMESFKGYGEYKNIPVFSELFKKVSQDIEEMNRLKTPEAPKNSESYKTPKNQE